MNKREIVWAVLIVIFAFFYFGYGYLYNDAKSRRQILNRVNRLVRIGDIQTIIKCFALSLKRVSRL